MPARSKSEKGLLPDKAAILKFIEESGETGKREIARAFGIKGADRIELKRILKELADEGMIGKRGKRVAQPGALPRITAIAITGRDEDGDLIARPVGWREEDQGSPPRIVILRPGGRRPPTLSVGVGDRVLARLEPIEERDGQAQAYRARPFKQIGKAGERTLGIFRENPVGPRGGRIEPVDRKALKQFDVAAQDVGEAKDGDLVSIEVTRRGRDATAGARIVETHGPASSQRVISRIAITAHGIPDTFSDAALAEAEKAKPATRGKRADWRKTPLITIDPPDARDHDDAVFAAPDEDGDNPGGWIVVVAIADVAEYVRSGSALDKTARERGNSVYFPDLVVPMLPERISNDLCSLRPGEDRPALAVRMVFSASGHKRAHRFERIIMRSHARLSYQDAQAAVDGQPNETTEPLLEGVLKPLWEAWRALNEARKAREPLDLDLPERRVELADDGSVKRIYVPPRLEAHRLIEEFMIQANVAAAETLEAKKSPLLYRVHDAPAPAKLEALREFLSSLDISLPKAGVLKPEHFNKILARVAESHLTELVNEVVLRAQARAEYSAGNYGHFGLNLRRYVHFTSPIRRYADLIVHRALIRALNLGEDGLADATIDELDEIAAQISAAERRAMAAERDTLDRLVAHYLSGRVGAVFDARISGVIRAGLFVELTETGADGFVPAASLEADFFRHDEKRQALIGERTGEMHRLGDSVQVRLVEAVPMAGALRFDLLTEGRYVAKREGAARSGKSARGGARQRSGGKAKAGKTTGGKTKSDKAKAGKVRPGKSPRTPRR